MPTKPTATEFAWAEAVTRLGLRGNPARATVAIALRDLEIWDEIIRAGEPLQIIAVEDANEERPFDAGITVAWVGLRYAQVIYLSEPAYRNVFRFCALLDA